MVAKYVGSDACASCHSEEHAAWRGSNHASAEAVVGESDPALQGPLPFDRVHEPVRTIGVEPLRQYLVEFPGQRFQVTQHAWDPARAEWFDVFDDGRVVGDWGHWLGRGMTWNSMCASCHNVGVTNRYDPVADRWDTQVQEHGVGCEGCHGPGGAHVAGGSPPRARPWLDTCGGCHARRMSLSESTDPTQPFLDAYSPEWPDLSPTYHADGQIAGEVFETVSFLGSRMAQVGISCVQCHDPHTSALVADGDALCLGCHEGQPAYEEHAHHPAHTCVGCHMPTTVYMQRDPRHDHSFPIPDPSLSDSLGSPNACQACHTEQTADWILTAWKEWYPNAAHRPHRSRASALSLARAGDPGAGSALLQVANTDPHPFWQAISLSMLGPWAHDVSVRERIDRGVASSDAWERLAAVRALSDSTTSSTLDLLGDAMRQDRFRAVRVEAALGMRASLSPASSEAAELHTFINANRDQPSVTGDLGAWWLEHGHLEEGIVELTRALDWDPNRGQVRRALAVGLARAGRSEHAVEVLAEGARRHPQDADMHRLLGLGLAGLERWPEATRALHMATTLEPGRARTWYNLALAFERSGDRSAGLTALHTALEHHPANVELLWALAGASERAGLATEARGYAREVLKRQPGHAGAHALLQR